MWALPGKHTWVLWKKTFGFLCTTSGRNMITPGLKSSERELTFSWSINIYFPLGLPGYFLVYSPRSLCSVQFLHVVFDHVAVFSLRIETVLVFVCLFVFWRKTQDYLNISDFLLALDGFCPKHELYLDFIPFQWVGLGTEVGKLPLRCHHPIVLMMAEVNQQLLSSTSVHKWQRAKIELILSHIPYSKQNLWLNAKDAKDAMDDSSTKCFKINWDCWLGTKRQTHTFLQMKHA